MTGGHDLLIVGGGPAGLAAGLYASRSRIDTLLVERLSPGGYLAMTDRIENYPGFPEATGGPSLAAAMEAQARRYGLAIAGDIITRLARTPEGFVAAGEEAEYRARAVILAQGADLGRLGIPGETQYIGRGVSYCATCDGAFFKGREIAVVGGGDAALEEAIYLTRFAPKVHIIHRRDAFRAAKVVQEEARAHPSIILHLSRVATAIEGDDVGVRRVVLRDVVTGATEDLAVEGIFVFIGYSPRTSFLPPEVELDTQGYVATDTEMRTSVPGLFAAGDVRSKRLRQVVTAVGDGATAAFAAQGYLEELDRGRTR